MKLSDYIEKYGDCEVTDEIDKCIVKAPKTVYDLKYGDEYFFLTESEIRRSVWYDEVTCYARLGICNVFLTEKDAEFAYVRLMVLTELKKYAKEFSNEEWEKTNLPKYYLYFDYNSYVISIGSVCFSKDDNIYFESKEKAQEAIKAVGDDRIKKYYLGVKE